MQGVGQEVKLIWDNVEFEKTRHSCDVNVIKRIQGVAPEKQKKITVRSKF